MASATEIEAAARTTGSPVEIWISSRRIGGVWAYIITVSPMPGAGGSTTTWTHGGYYEGLPLRQAGWLAAGLKSRGIEVVEQYESLVPDNY